VHILDYFVDDSWRNVHRHHSALIVANAAIELTQATTASICRRNAISLVRRAARAALYSDVSFGELMLT
jgi:hypothetical protein